MRTCRPTLLVALALLAIGCAFIEGRVEATVDGHHLVVTDCYRSSVPPPDKPSTLPDGTTVYRWAPCRDAQIVIRGKTLLVNDREIGPILPGDEVIVDHGKPSIKSR